MGFLEGREGRAVEGTVNLFVYGTLKKGAGGKMHHLIRPYVCYVGEGFTHGRLYQLAGYPGLVMRNGGREKVWGELYQTTSAEFLFEILDTYEGCSNRQNRPHEYRRVEAEVILKGGRRVSAWLYEYIAPLRGARWIPTGTWSG